jgi:hypothetical protein
MEMKYTIETTKEGCIETLELNDGTKVIKHTARTDYGCKSKDQEFSEQLKGKIGLRAVDELEDLFDGSLNYDFLRINEMLVNNEDNYDEDPLED